MSHDIALTKLYAIGPVLFQEIKRFLHSTDITHCKSPFRLRRLNVSRSKDMLYHLFFLRNFPYILSYFAFASSIDISCLNKLHQMCVKTRFEMQLRPPSASGTT